MSPRGDRSQRLRAVLRLRELILDGELPAGARIAEIPLAERLGLSRTPLRLALAQLEHEGLVEALPGGGFAVRAFALRDVTDALELRGTLEGLAARLAAERLEQSPELEALYGCVGQLNAVLRHERLSVAEFERYVTLNERFHELLVTLARSGVLLEAIRHANAKPFASPSAFVRVQAELPESHEILHAAQEQHREILAAIEARDGERAEALTREHARLAGSNLDVALASHGALARLPGGALIRLPEVA
jgi:GntR family transcriptional regulator of vanillate catabolism